MRTRSLLALLAPVACVAIALDALRPVWVPSEMLPGQYQRAYYEIVDDAVGLTVDEARNGYMSPDVDLDRRGRLSVPPGRTIGVPIENDVEYLVSNDGRSSAPYVAVGFEVPLAGGSDPESREFPPSAFGGLRVLDARDGELAWREWDPSRPWTQDRAWLSVLTDTCRDQSGGAALSLRREGEALVARLGHCSLRSILPAQPANSRLAMAVVAGPDWAAVERPHDGWRTTRPIAWWFIAAVIGVIALLRVGLGALPTAILALWIWLLALFGILPALLAFIASAVAAVLAALWMLTGRVFRGRQRLRVASFAGLGAALLIVPTVIAFRLGDTAANGRELRSERAHNACGLIGYSTVRGDALRHGTVGAWAYLDGPCAACSGATARYAREAQTIDWVRDTACAPSFTLAPGGTLLFLGGGNDDFFWRKSKMRQAFRLIGLLYYAYERPDQQTWQHFLTETSDGSLSMIGEQTGAIHGLAACLQTRGQRLLFAHDFLMWDLEDGRSPPRRAMLDQRRAAVEASGGQFVDLREALGPRAGVSWFNDFIHPSAVGHLRIAELLCSTIAAHAGR
jgi:hypothetical protein